MSKLLLKDLYELLLNKYGKQGWWPIINSSSLKCEYNILPEGIPRTKNEQWEIITGCLLTQNTQWHPNVTTAIANLKKENLLHPEKLIYTDIEKIKNLIKSAGYFNQKSERLVLLAKWFLSLDDSIPSRDDLLKLKGIGPETADSILLYAFNVPIFIVDTYTKRILLNLKIINDEQFNSKDSYNIVKNIFETNLKNINEKEKSSIFKELHALLVVHAKQFYQKKSTWKDDWLLKEY